MVPGFALHLTLDRPADLLVSPSHVRLEFRHDPADERAREWPFAFRATQEFALTDSTPEMGCIRLLPGSHVIGQRPHKDTSTPGNLLSRGQTIEHRLDYTRAVMMPLKAGQISLHHTHIVHSSEPNRTNQRRIGIGVSYIPPHCRLVNDVRVTAALVRGRDEHGHFDLEPQPTGNFDAASRAASAFAPASFKRPT
jgi:hypothetical protein